MGVGYSIEPWAEFVRHPQGQALLASVGLAVPADPGAGRLPSLNELLGVLDAVEEYAVEFVEAGHSWQITVEWDGPESAQALANWVTLECARYGGDPDTPQPFWVYIGDPEDALAVLQRLVPLCGPLVLTTEYGEWIVVDERTDRKAEWHETPGEEA